MCFFYLKEIGANTTKGYYIESGRREVFPGSYPPKGELMPYEAKWEVCLLL